MNRTDLQTIAELRLKESKFLLEQNCFDGAYYLLGYVVECALKSCIAKQFREHDFPDKKLVLDSYTHELPKLLSISGLKPKLEQETANNPELDSNWAIVKDWSEQSRYQYGTNRLKAFDLYNAITDRDTGVLSWLKNWW